MASSLNVEGEEPIVFTEIEPCHRDRLVEMHEELFPVSYSKNFYDKAIQKIGIRGGDLFTSIAFQKRGEANVMVGFIMSQFLPLSQCDERMDLFDGLGEPEQVYYILTLGVEKGMRRTGLGTELLRQSVQHASSSPVCGAVSVMPVSSYSIEVCCTVLYPNTTVIVAIFTCHQLQHPGTSLLQEEWVHICRAVSRCQPAPPAHTESSILDNFIFDIMIQIFIRFTIGGTLPSYVRCISMDINLLCCCECKASSGTLR